MLCTPLSIHVELDHHIAVKQCLWYTISAIEHQQSLSAWDRGKSLKLIICIGSIHKFGSWLIQVMYFHECAWCHLYCQMFFMSPFIEMLIYISAPLD